MQRNGHHRQGEAVSSAGSGHQRQGKADSSAGKWAS